jgi:hypothetical protein
LSPILGIIASQNYPRVTNSYESIATVTVSSAVSSITFSSIPSTYQHLQVRALVRCSFTGSTAKNITSQMNSDTGNNYYRHYLLGNGSAASAGSDAGTVIYAGTAVAAGSLASTFGVNVFDYLDYSNTNKNKTVRVLNGFDENGAGNVYLTSGLWNSTAAISTLTFTVEGGFNFNQYSQFALYGIKG